MKLSGNVEELKALLARLDRLGEVGEWQRDREAEGEIERQISGPGTVRCFRNAPSGELPDSRLWLRIKQTEWSVTNIVPAGSGPIAPWKYSALLSSFRTALLPLLANTTITVSEPAFEVGPEHWLSPNAVRLLQRFSALANKSTGASHPSDRVLWNEFVIATHRDKCKIGGSDLAQLLIEDEHWPESKASELGVLLEYERSLLSDLDKHA